MSSPVELSIIIKALNEELHIVAAVRSAKVAAEKTGCRYEVIVADSLSTDRTAALALAEGARVVRLRCAADRGCGAGVQLGYQFAAGQWIYLMDGDMTLHPDFLCKGLAALQADPSLAGVAGLLEDTRLRNDVDRIRAKNGLSARSGEQPWLNAGGLFRRQAIESAGGYAADVNLKAYEEADLGMRLRASGWRLLRLGEPAVLHTGHDLDTWALLRRHWRSRRAMAAGVLLRGAVGKPWLAMALRLLLHPVAVLCAWWIASLALLLAPGEWRGFALLTGVAGGIGIWLALAVRKRDFRHATLSLVHWHYGALAILTGLTYGRRDPVRGVGAVELDADQMRREAQASA